MTTPVLPKLDVHGPNPGSPEFAPAMRGYDRGQVDDYVARLGDFLADAEQRAQRAEAAMADLIERNERVTDELRLAIDRRNQRRSGEPYEGLGERISEILRLATEEADSVRAQARSEAEAMVAEAGRHREAERDSCERELADMTTRRDAVVAELRRVQEVLATLGLADHVLPAEVVEAAAAEPSDPDQTATRAFQRPTVDAPS
ncbi:MAG TPA: DivIVA domain-containing protein [Mycobacteriales bacterium]|nr:DivIVA domain-containing protein [Mycobacteriales bacterium]HWB68144.1 DivIVA domain-containing protein [Mycobacteriales bacterium]